jgi:general secretion pathway protein D
MTIDVVANIVDNGKVDLNINPAVASAIDEGIKDSSGNSVPTILQRSLTTSAVVPNGMTILVGGLIQTQNSDNGSGLPGFSKIPFFGKTVLGNSSKNNSKTTLLVFVTPKIIYPDQFGKIRTEGEAANAYNRAIQEDIDYVPTPMGTKLSSDKPQLIRPALPLDAPVANPTPGFRRFR